MSGKPDREREQALAQLFEERMGDVSGWKPAPRPIRSRRGGPSSVFSVRFAKDELGVVQEAAAKDGKTVSAFIRDAAIEAAQPRYFVYLAVRGETVLGDRAVRRTLALSPAGIA